MPGFIIPIPTGSFSTLYLHSEFKGSYQQSRLTMPVEKDVVVLRGGSQTSAVRWCYFFTVLHIRRRFLYTWYDGTEDGTRYMWKKWDWPLRWGEERKEGCELCRRGLLTPW